MGSALFEEFFEGAFFSFMIISFFLKGDQLWIPEKMSDTDLGGMRLEILKELELRFTTG